MRAISLLVIAALLAPNFAHAAQGLSCSTVASVEETQTLLSQQLELDLDRRKDRKLEKKIQKIDFDKDYSENDVRLLIRKLFDKKFGQEVSFSKDVFKKVERANDERISRLLAEEIASQGLIKFFEENGQLATGDHVKTLWHRIFHNRKTQVALFVVSLARMHMPVPAPYIPHFLPFRPSETQLATLMLYGRDSEEGKAVLAELAPRFARDNRRILAVKALNTMALIVTLIMWFIVEDNRAEEVTSANGELFVQHLAKQIDKIDAEATSLNDTENDHLYDIVTKKLEATHGTLTPSDRSEICTQIAAKNRCQVTF